MIVRGRIFRIISEYFSRTSEKYLVFRDEKSIRVVQSGIIAQMKNERQNKFCLSFFIFIKKGEFILFHLPRFAFEQKITQRFIRFFRTNRVYLGFHFFVVSRSFDIAYYSDSQRKFMWCMMSLAVVASWVRISSRVIPFSPTVTAFNLYPSRIRPLSIFLPKSIFSP